MDLWTRFRGYETAEVVEVELTQAEEIDLEDFLVVDENEELKLEEGELDTEERMASSRAHGGR